LSSIGASAKNRTTAPDEKRESEKAARQITRKHGHSARLAATSRIDLVAYSTCVSTLVRVANKIGIRRLPRDITPPGVADYLQHKEREKAAQA
jgi:hypothetical protein